MWWAELLNNILAVLGDGAGAAANSYESIATVSLSSSQSSITFSSIPSTYKHLQIRLIAQYASAGSGAQDSIMRFNGDSTNGNYYINHQLYGDGASAGASAAGSGTGLYMAYIPRQFTPSIFLGGVIDILDYQNSNKNKVVRSLTGWDANGSGYTMLRSGLWLSTSAISSIVFSELGGLNFAAGSSFALYGVKG